MFSFEETVEESCEQDNDTEGPLSENEVVHKAGNKMPAMDGIQKLGSLLRNDSRFDGLISASTEDLTRAERQKRPK